MRAVDDAGNIGPLATLDLRPPDATPDQGAGPGTTTGDGTTPGGPGDPSVGVDPPRPDLTPSSCSPIRALAGAGVRPTGRRLRMIIPRTAGPTTVDVFQQSVRRRVGDRLIARFSGQRASFLWNGLPNQAGRRIRDGVLMVRFRARGESVRVALRRRGGRFAVRPGYYRPALCRVLASAKLLRPVFSGRRPLQIAFRLDPGGARHHHGPARLAPRAPVRRARVRGQPHLPSRAAFAPPRRPPRDDRRHGGWPRGSGDAGLAAHLAAANVDESPL